tara:strand:- start:7 stop:324 length:318 start_codon:yes stop_codon:yes gene_type:complete
MDNNNDAKEWFENSEYQYTLDEHDEGGFVGIDSDEVGKMLEEYHKYKKNKELNLLIRNLSSILSKTKYLKNPKSSANLRTEKTEQILEKVFECLKLVGYRIVEHK